MLLRGLPQGKISNPFLVDARCRPRQHEIHEKVQKLSACDLVRFEQALEHASLVDSQDQSRDAREVPGNDAESSRRMSASAPSMMTRIRPCRSA